MNYYVLRVNGYLYIPQSNDEYDWSELDKKNQIS